MQQEAALKYENWALARAVTLGSFFAQRSLQAPANVP